MREVKYDNLGKFRGKSASVVSLDTENKQLTTVLQILTDRFSAF